MMCGYVGGSLLMDTHMHTDGYLTLGTGGKGNEKPTSSGVMGQKEGV